MSRGLLLIDLQHDFLQAPGLLPSAGPLLERVGQLLKSCRARGFPVFHVRTTVAAGGLGMPHWQNAGRTLCREGSTGWQAPPELQPLPAETVVSKLFYSGFEDGSLHAALQAQGVNQLWVSGVHTHACVRATVLDAYARGYRLRVADDAIASDDPLAAELARDFMQKRVAQFEPVASLLAGSSQPSGRLRGIPVPLWGDRRFVEDPHWWRQPPMWQHVSPRDSSEARFWLPLDGPGTVAAVAGRAREAGEAWRFRDHSERQQLLLRLADGLEAAAPALCARLVADIGKPVQMARAELARSATRLRQCAAEAAPEDYRASEGSARRRPLGTVALITPWNHALGIAVGRLAPALLYGNAVLWKPALPGAALAVELMRLLEAAGAPAGLVGLVQGGADTARVLMDEPLVDAVSLTGSGAAGMTAAAHCARRLLPLQAELGGNNAAIVMPDCDLAEAARGIAFGAFGFAGQRCTANRRAVVAKACLPAFLAALRDVVEGLRWGDPREPDTVLGPLISVESRARFQALLRRAEGACERFPWAPSFEGEDPELGAYHPPVVVVCEDARHELVQEESFAPMLVVQPADDFAMALQLAEQVPQGLVGALFSADPKQRTAFRRTQRAGLLKLGQATTGAGLELPFGGWKASGFGPPQHGPGNLEFYTRWQAEYHRGEP